MEQRICTEEEIKQLHTFCKKHFVNYADVREELVDHLASGMEASWQVDPNLNFDGALYRVYQKFGQLGFRKVVYEKENAIRKAHVDLQKKYLFRFIKPPQIFITLLMCIALFCVVPEDALGFKWTVGICFSAVLILFFVFSYYFFKRWRKIFKTREILILKSATRGIYGLGIAPTLGVNMVSLTNGYEIVPLWLRLFFLLSIVTVFVFISFYFLLLNQSEKEVKEKYPQLTR